VWPDWAIFWAVGAFFSDKYRPNDLGAIFFKKSPQIHLNKPYIQKIASQF
jgi:hypothetical protein